MIEAFEDDDFLPISGLQHLVFCKRQCALIHVDRIWHDNELTVEGSIVHERAHAPSVVRAGKTAFGLRLRTDRLRLVGQADAVEFVPDAAGSTSPVPYPVEYKRGRTGERLADRVQLCAQAIALEEMIGVDVRKGALYYHASKRRDEVFFDDDLRNETERLARQFHELVHQRRLPPGIRRPKCRRCSLLDVCQPSVDTDLKPASYCESLFDSLSKRWGR